MEGCYI